MSHHSVIRSYTAEFDSAEFNKPKATPQGYNWPAFAGFAFCGLMWTAFAALAVAIL